MFQTALFFLPPLPVTYLPLMSLIYKLTKIALIEEKIHRA